VLTPHPGEMARLANISIAEVQANRLEWARTFAQRYGVTLVLKGARTVIAHPTAVWRQHHRQSACQGGSGDLLTGLIAGFSRNTQVARPRPLKRLFIFRLGRGLGRSPGPTSTLCWPPTVFFQLSSGFSL